ncbi:MAG: hypothetical protein H0U40_04155 [Chloroflexia bacterium]|nr:hypothetical protein [Chloroflexia bacterium]MDQ3514794.1 hypothetical protein [Chloroflexota bacterium]
MTSDGERGANEPAWRIEITPEPTPDEQDAIVAALVVLGLSPVVVPAAKSAVPSRWSMAGRRAAHDGLSPTTRHGFPERL